MTLNGTLLVQIVNFVLAYLIIERLLLRRSVEAIEEERLEQSQLMGEIQVERDRVLHSEEEKKTSWECFRERFGQMIPKMLTRWPLTMEPKNDLKRTEAFSESDVEQAATQLKKVLINKVMHVDS